MKIIERFIRGIFLFLFGLATGGVCMWFMTINALEGEQKYRPRRVSSYRDYFSNSKNSE